MSFGSDLEAGRAELQAHAESAMRDKVCIERKSGTSLDPDTYQEVDTYEVVYEGWCKVRATPVQASSAVAGEVSYDVSHSYLDLPLSDPVSGVVTSGDRATLTECWDAANVGRVFVVQRDVPRSYPIERRLFCEEVS